MLAFPEESFGRPFDSLDFDGFYDFGDEGLILEALGSEIEYETIDYDFCDIDSVQSSRCSSSGVPSCSSSPCSSERDYGCDRFTSQSSFIDFMESDSDLNLHSCTKKLKNKINSTEKRKRKHLEKRSRGSSKSRNTWKTDLDRVLTCIECSWSDLDTEKQQETLELLIETVSQKLGLREQLQLIQIISPNANVSPSDTEFFIDFELFDDEKFKGVCNFVKRHLKLLHDGNKYTSDDETLHQTSAKRNKESVPASPTWNDKEKTLEKKVLAKTSKQIRKEKRSGLFKQEEVLLIKEGQDNIPEDEEDEELDVVG